jgi:hypothetical protein
MRDGAILNDSAVVRRLEAAAELQKIAPLDENAGTSTPSSASNGIDQSSISL